MSPQRAACFLRLCSVINSVVLGHVLTVSIDLSTEQQVPAMLPCAVLTVLAVGMISPPPVEVLIGYRLRFLLVQDAVEKALMKVATRGVVRLFNAVSQAQKQKLEESVMGKRAKVRSPQRLSSRRACVTFGDQCITAASFSFLA